MTLQASMFLKLSVFLIIQIFFVQMLSGSIISNIQSFINEPTTIITTLAIALPLQAQSFMQYVIVQTAVDLGMALSRAKVIGIGLLRQCFGPRLSKAERQRPWLCFEPYNSVVDCEYAELQGYLILYYMILFCYSVMSPFTSIIMFSAFGLFSLGYRHLIFYTYGRQNDSGGQLFGDFVSLAVACIIISEFVIFVNVFLKGGVAPAILIAILIGFTFLFKAYINQQHYDITKYLPSTIAVDEDSRNISQIDWEGLLKGVYRQPERKEKYKEPENMSVVREQSRDNCTLLCGSFPPSIEATHVGNVPAG